MASCQCMTVQTRTERTSLLNAPLPHTLQRQVKVVCFPPLPQTHPAQRGSRPLSLTQCYPCPAALPPIQRPRCRRHNALETADAEVPQFIRRSCKCCRRRQARACARRGGRQGRARGCSNRQGWAIAQIQRSIISDAASPMMKNDVAQSCHGSACCSSRTTCSATYRPCNNSPPPAAPPPSPPPPPGPGCSRPPRRHPRSRCQCAPSSVAASVRCSVSVLALLSLPSAKNNSSPSGPRPTPDHRTQLESNIRFSRRFHVR